MYLRPEQRRKGKEEGMVLIIALIVLLMLMILGTAAMKTTVMEERLSGFTRNKQLSFDSSETALRIGEGAADALPLTAPLAGAAGLFAPNPANPVWLDATVIPSWITLPGGAVAGVGQQPRYVLEATGSVPRDNNCALDAEASANQDCWRYTYRVTSQGTGLNNNTTSVVQSTILSRK